MFERRLERVRKVDKDEFWNDRKIFEKIGFCIFAGFFILVNRRWRAIRFHRQGMSIYLRTTIQHQMDIQL